MSGLPQLVRPRPRVLWSEENPWRSQQLKQVPGQANELFAFNWGWVGLRGT